MTAAESSIKYKLCTYFALFSVSLSLVVHYLQSFLTQGGFQTNFVSDLDFSFLWVAVFLLTLGCAQHANAVSVGGESGERHPKTPKAKNL